MASKHAVAVSACRGLVSRNLRRIEVSLFWYFKSDRKLDALKGKTDRLEIQAYNKTTLTTLALN